MTNHPIDSPFSSTPSIAAPTGRSPRSKATTWIVAGGALLVILLLAAFFTIRHLNDPFRQLEEFPVARYFEGHQPLAGLKFRSDLRVDADLGWKEGVGRLMVFTPANDSRQLAVFIPPDLSHIFFNKGQTYTVELQIKEGGLIHANDCRKN